jgi:hypothetical protein
MVPSMDPRNLRAWWSHRQGLDGTLAGKSPAAALERSGWARSVAGAGPYLGIFARTGAGREATDQSVAELAIHELPSARGCTYVVPQSEFALALKVGQAFAGGDMSAARTLGVTDAEVAKLCDAVLQALGSGPLEPDELRQAVGGAARSLGEAGRKKGITTTLPLALGRLQPAGEIRRIPTNGRLDNQRYRYALWQPNPLAGFTLSAEEAYTELARRYFAWTGPATLAEFQWFSGLGAKAAKAAVEPLALEPVGQERLIPPGLRREFEKYRAPAKPRYSLVGSLDAILLLRRNLPTVMDEADYRRTGGVADLPSHAILDRGCVIGFWEFDPAAASIVWMTFAPADAKLRDAVRRSEAFVRDELGDARSFSLDSPRSRAPRIEAMRAASLSGPDPS